MTAKRYSAQNDSSPSKNVKPPPHKHKNKIIQAQRHFGHFIIKIYEKVNFPSSLVQFLISQSLL